MDLMMHHNKSIAVVLFQLGGPDSLDAVKPFLYNLFCDPDIIDFPGAFLARKPLAKFISSRRSKKVLNNYRTIGGKSPINDLTIAQARALEAEINKQIDAKVFVAMRYWHPLTEEVVQEIRSERFDKIILLPLFPHYSKATTGSSFNEWNRQCTLNKMDVSNTKIITAFYNHSLYIEAVTENIRKALTKFSKLTADKIDLVFSAHGTPMSLVREGDPYNDHIKETVRLVLEKGEWKSPHVLCYQSRIGPVKWLKPSLKETIHNLGANGRKHLLIVPISFVTDHIETLHEINIEIRQEAEYLGIEQFEIMPALNDSPKFIQCLKELVLTNI